VPYPERDMKRYAAAIVLLLVACGGDRPSRADWMAEVWVPMRDAIPVPTEANEAACDEALGVVRDVSENLRPAPSTEIGDAADEWVRKGEALMFDCAAGDVEDYDSRYAELLRAQNQVERLLG